MIPLEYSRAEMRQLKSLLESAHNMKIRVRLLSQDHDFLDDISDRFVGGQVNYDMDADVDRSLDIEFADPARRIHVDSKSAAEGVMWADRMLSVVYVIANPTGTANFSIPVFTGPIETASRDGFFLKVKCMGKETLGMSNMFHGKTYKKGMARTTVIRSILTDIMGELPRKVSIPDRPQRLARNISMNRDDKPWLVAQRIAASMGMDLFYDGRGVCRMRKRPRASTWTYREGDLTSVPSVGFDLEGVINVVSVVGAKPKGAKQRIRYSQTAPVNHPLSPYQLGRQGKPRFLPLFIQDDTIKSMAEAKSVCRDALEHGLLTGVDVSFNAVPNPLAELGDIQRVHHEEWGSRFRLRRFSLPLVAGESMAVGYIRRVQPRGEVHRYPKGFVPGGLQPVRKRKKKEKKGGARKGR